jgi:hypothetical protein
MLIKMKPILIFLMLIFAATTSYAQQVVASSGNTGTITGYKVDWTLGEPVIETISGSNFILTQGMHQTKFLITSLNEIEYPGLEVKVYPNPAGNFLKIEVIQTGNEEFQYELTDIAGRKLLVKERFSNTEEINMDSYVSGIYLIRILNSNRDDVKVFKIIKN